MSVPINPSMLAKPASGANPLTHMPQMQQWQQEMARAQGQMIAAQSRNTAPQFAAGAPAGQPPIRPLPASTPSAVAKPAATLPALAARAPASPGPRADAARPAALFEPTVSAFVRSATHPLQTQARLDERRDSPLPPAADAAPSPHTLAQALAAELHPLDASSASQIQVGAHLTHEGLAIALRVQGPLALEASRLCAATLGFCALHGLSVATLRCNDQLIFDGRRRIDTLEPVSKKD